MGEGVSIPFMFAIQGPTTLIGTRDYGQICHKCHGCHRWGLLPLGYNWWSVPAWCALSSRWGIILGVPRYYVGVGRRGRLYFFLDMMEKVWVEYWVVKTRRRQVGWLKDAYGFCGYLDRRIIQMATDKLLWRQYQLLKKDITVWGV